jgi:hypothetical protein
LLHQSIDSDANPNINHLMQAHEASNHPTIVNPVWLEHEADGVGGVDHHGASVCHLISRFSATHRCGKWGLPCVVLSTTKTPWRLQFHITTAESKDASINQELGVLLRLGRTFPQEMTDLTETIRYQILLLGFVKRILTLRVIDVNT